MSKGLRHLLNPSSEIGYLSIFGRFKKSYDPTHVVLENGGLKTVIKNSLQRGDMLKGREPRQIDNRGRDRAARDKPVMPRPLVPRASFFTQKTGSLNS